MGAQAKTHSQGGSGEATVLLRLQLKAYGLSGSEIIHLTFTNHSCFKSLKLQKSTTVIKTEYCTQSERKKWQIRKDRQPKGKTSYSYWIAEGGGRRKLIWRNNG